MEGCFLKAFELNRNKVIQHCHENSAFHLLQKSSRKKEEKYEESETHRYSAGSSDIENTEMSALNQIRIKSKKY